MNMKKKISKLFALLTATSMLITIPSLTTIAGAADATVTETTTGVVSTADDDSLVRIESYLTHSEIESISSKPCDIIFVLDQSKWMNTEDNKGEDRATVLQTMQNMMQSLSTPAYSEHRVAIVGYGTLNMGSNAAPYDEETYPGVQEPIYNSSLDTGYYTKDGFNSINGWVDLADVSDTALPEMPDDYLVNEAYDDVFMSLSDAEEAINPDTMRAWYSEDARFDAGMAMAEQLAEIAKAHDENSDRDLIICITASSIPPKEIDNYYLSVKVVVRPWVIRNNDIVLNSASTATGIIDESDDSTDATDITDESNDSTDTTNIADESADTTSNLRDAAVLAAAEDLKNKGATIFVYGNYHNSGTTYDEGNQDTYELFYETMAKISGNSETSDDEKENYFFSLNDYDNVIDAMNKLKTNVIVEAVGVGNRQHTINVNQLTNGSDTISVSDLIASQDPELWQKALTSKTAKIEYFDFTGYKNGEAQFESTPVITNEVSISELFAKSDSEISYETNIAPVPPNTQYTADNNSIYGQKVVITFSLPQKLETPNATPEPTLEPLPSGEPIELDGIEYAYIFGYEPHLIERLTVTDEDGNESGVWNVEIRMAPEDNVTREQVAAMIMRMIDQKYNTMDADYPLTDNISAHAGTWYERGLAYLASKGAFDGIDKVYTGSVTRGEVAKLISYGLNLSDSAETTFTDIENSPYKKYIEIMNAYGYMQGESDTEFAPDKIMTRAEFCSLFNRIIGREDALLEAADGTQVTPQLFYFVDLPDDAWYTPVMLRATSAYDSDGYVDIDTRLSNIRNTLDKYDSQKLF
jgi:hypothetical protein